MMIFVCQVIRTSQLIGRLAGRHASHQADRQGEMTSFPLKHLGSRRKTHSKDFQWSSSDYATLSCSHDFKHPLKQKFCDMFSDPDLLDDRRLRPDLNRHFLCDTLPMSTRHLKG